MNIMLAGVLVSAEPAGSGDRVAIDNEYLLVVARKHDG